MRSRSIAIKKAFSGSDYIQELDSKRLSGQLRRIFELMNDGKWRSLREISEITGYGEASVSAQLRNLRKSEFGNFIVEKNRSGNPESGLFLYRIVKPERTYEQMAFLEVYAHDSNAFNNHF